MEVLDAMAFKDVVNDLRQAHNSLQGNTLDIDTLRNSVTRAKDTIEKAIRLKPKGTKHERRWGKGQKLQSTEEENEGEDSVTPSIPIGARCLFRGETVVRVVGREQSKDGNPVFRLERDGQQAKGGKNRGLRATEDQLRLLNDEDETSVRQEASSKNLFKTRDGRLVDRSVEKPRKRIFLNSQEIKPCDRDRCDRTLRRFFSRDHHYYVGEQALKWIRQSLGGNRGRVLDLIRALARHGDTLDGFERGFRRHVTKRLPDTSPARKRIDEIKAYVKKEWLWWRDKGYVAFRQTSKAESGEVGRGDAQKEKRRPGTRRLTRVARSSEKVGSEDDDDDDATQSATRMETGKAKKLKKATPERNRVKREDRHSRHQVESSEKKPVKKRDGMLREKKTAQKERKNSSTKKVMNGDNHTIKTKRKALAKGNRSK
eukprot:CAMPEP_0114512922 /NCGR_PEP_ID=MMETSP0109-20121206/15260_1 /TAXON_ID=29199 /ORGANISM="Chlorarachnion reptans, Strain CCCM449" /LENGTH=427 /DNA_ID=CAMNT_0001692691 /DNA_START=118 /DNA_END=1401 /DNA_ORIENTATION=-